MQLIQNNPYRVLGLLVGAKATQLSKHRTKLEAYLSAESEIPKELTDFSFDMLGKVERTVDSVVDAASKLSLDSDKMGAALFWFYSGNLITDEPAFDAIKEGDTDTAIEIWRKLAYDSDDESYNEVTKKNASAFHNLSTLYLEEYGIDADALQLKLLFLESDFFNDLKNKATDETYKISKKEIQLLFLNSLISQEEFNAIEFMDIISDLEFIAKDEFVNGFALKPIEEIERKIESSKNNRKVNKAQAEKIGQELLTSTAGDLFQLKSIVGANDLRYTSIADKVANEILQCSIDFFNVSQENDSSSDYAETAMKLAKQAETLAIGKLTKDRVKENIERLVEMKDIELSQAIAVLQSIKAAYEEACRQIDKQVDELHYDTFPTIGASPPMRVRKFDVSIDWSKVEEMKRSCLAWGKVAELVREAIPAKNIDKIKKASDTTKVNEFKTLFNFLMSKISYSHKNSLAYICYWESPKITSSTNTSTPTPSTIPSGEEGIPDWLKWIGGIILFLLIVGAIWGEEGLSIVFGIVMFLLVMLFIGFIKSIKI